MTIEMLAAILAPRDMAPHPNFRNSDSISPNDAQALALNFRPSSWQMRAPALIDERAKVPEEATPIADACRRALSLGTYQAGTDALVAESQRLGADGWMDAATTEALIAACMLSEMDKHTEAIELIGSLLSLPGWADIPTGEQQILRSVLLSQLAMREFELHGDGHGLMAVEEADSLLRGLSSASVRPFNNSSGVTWGYKGTVRRIVEAQKATLRGLHVSSDGFSGTGWTKAIRVQRPALQLEAESVGLQGYRHLVDYNFDDITLSSTSESDISEADHGLWLTLMHHELCGDWANARVWRLRLGQMRVLRHKGTQGVASASDGLQLIRHSGNTQEYVKALRSIRSSGPLHELQDELALVVKHRLAPRRLYKAELAVLRSGGQLLSVQDAKTVLDVLDQAVTAPTYAPPGKGWQHPGSRLEEILKAASEVVQVAGDEELLADRMLAHVVSGHIYLESLAYRAYAAFVRNLDWGKVNNAVKQKWLTWFEQNQVTDDDPDKYEFQGLYDAVHQHISLESGTSTRFGEAGREVTLGDLASRLNTEVITKGELSLTNNEMSSAAAILTPALRDIQMEARKGTYSFGGYSSPDLAAMVVTGDKMGLAETRPIWEALVELLAERGVARDDKEPVLTRLRLGRQHVPEWVKTALRANLDSLLDTPLMPSWPGNSEGVTSVFPEALRMAMALDIITSKSAFPLIYKLLGSSDERERVEGAMCLAIAASDARSTFSAWAGPISVLVTYDRSANVRAHGGLALAKLSGPKESLEPGVITERLTALLMEDGSMVPTLILYGLLETSDRETRKLLTGVLGVLSNEHKLHSVRVQASTLLELASKD